MQSPVEILIIEPSFLIREGIKTLLSQMEIAFRMDESDTVIHNLNRLIQKSNPGIVMINPSMMKENLLINRSDPELSSIFFIALVQNDLPDALSSQFDALLHLCASKTELIKETEEILTKAGIISSEKESNTLSGREIDILRLVALGLTNNEISEKLFISVHTAMTHRKNITRKLGIKTVSGLTVYAILNKLIKTEELKGRL
ncbi:MAG: LuxR C-terminal-related transcriptional regulator [Bacteroidales bacterium]|nr:LuxR C-terminal-related transcriptional regulator [Bacteroidales bacterium]